MAKKLISITYEIWDEEAQVAGETNDNGWIDEEGESMMPADYFDDQGSAVKNAIDYLRQHGPVLEPNEVGKGAASRWYTDYEYGKDYRTGETEQRSYHLDGFSEEERRKIQKAVEERSYMNNPDKTAILGRIGDVNPIEYGGGIVIETEHGPSIEYTHGLETERIDKDDEDVEDANVVLTVYQVSVESDVVDDLNWADWKEVAAYQDMSVKELRKLAKSNKVTDRAQVYESVASFNGWYELDQYPLKLTARELEQRWFPGEDDYASNSRTRKKSNKDIVGVGRIARWSRVNEAWVITPYHPSWSKDVLDAAPVLRVVTKRSEAEEEVRGSR